MTSAKPTPTMSPCRRTRTSTVSSAPAAHPSAASRRRRAPAPAAAAPLRRGAFWPLLTAAPRRRSPQQGVPLGPRRPVRGEARALSWGGPLEWSWRGARSRPGRERAGRGAPRGRHCWSAPSPRASLPDACHLPVLTSAPCNERGPGGRGAGACCPSSLRRSCAQRTSLGMHVRLWSVASTVRPLTGERRSL